MGENMKLLITNIKKLHKPLLILTIVLFGIGLLMIQSASAVESFMGDGLSPYHYFLKQFFTVILGVIAYLIIICIPTSTYKWLYKPAILGIIGILFLLQAVGTISNNALSWFRYGIFGLQPTEFAKIILIVYMATYYKQKYDKINDNFTLLTPLMMMIAIVILTVFQPDLGTALIIAGIGGAMFYAVPLDKKIRTNINKVLIAGVVLVLLILIFTKGNIITEGQKSRFNFLSPCTRYQEPTGYQVCNSFIAINNGGLLGKGIGNSTQKFLYLPFAYTDFIFAIIVEELGAIIGIAIVLMIGIVIYVIYNIGTKAKDLQGSLLCYGVFIYIFLHLLVNLGGVLGIMPMTGVPLPFLSYGGSYALSLIVSLGIVQRVYIEKDENKKKLLSKSPKKN